MSRKVDEVFIRHFVNEQLTGYFISNHSLRADSFCRNLHLALKKSVIRRNQRHAHRQTSFRRHPSSARSQVASGCRCMRWEKGQVADGRRLVPRAMANTTSPSADKCTLHRSLSNGVRWARQPPVRSLAMFHPDQADPSNVPPPQEISSHFQQRPRASQQALPIRRRLKKWT